MASVNKCSIIGNLGDDPKVVQFENAQIANISVATTERIKDKQSGEYRDVTEWHRIAFFGKLADVAAQYLKKGSQVYVEGKLRTRKYVDKTTGQEKYSTEIVADTMQMLGKKESSDSGHVGGTDFYKPPVTKTVWPQNPVAADRSGLDGNLADDAIPF